VYLRGDRATTDSLMGTANASLVSNTVYLGVDWRHWKHTGVRTGVERVLRGVIDFFEKNGGTVVPVELASFDAKARGNDVDVFWSTASERNADHFVIERANAVTAGEPVFEAVGTVDAAGNSTTTRDYIFRDRSVSNGSYLYRLMMVDADGTFDHSSDVNVVIGSAEALRIVGVQPQPATGPASMTYFTPTAGNVSIEVVNVNGQVVGTLAGGDVAAGEHVVDIPSTFANGSYTIVVRTDVGTATMPFVVRR
jgi:hypothetical protein